MLTDSIKHLILSTGLDMLFFSDGLPRNFLEILVTAPEAAREQHSLLGTRWESELKSVLLTEERAFCQ